MNLHPIQLKLAQRFDQLKVVYHRIDALSWGSLHIFRHTLESSNQAHAAIASAAIDLDSQ